MVTDVWYVLNPRTNRFVRASGKLGWNIRDYPTPAIMIDTDHQLIAIDMPDRSIRVKRLDIAKKIARAYGVNSTLYYHLIERWWTDG